MFFRYLSDVFWEAISSGNVLSLYQGLGTKNLQSFISSFIYFYSYSYFKRLHSQRIGSKSIGTKANLLIAAAAGACTSVLTQVRFFIIFALSSASMLYAMLNFKLYVCVASRYSFIKDANKRVWKI